MFRLINKKDNIIYYNYKELGYILKPTKNAYIILKDNKDVTNDFVVSIAINLSDSKGRELFTEDKVDFDTESTYFNFGVIKFTSNGFVVQTKEEIIPIENIKKITLSDEYNDSISGKYL